MSKISTFAEVESLLQTYARPMDAVGGYTLERITAMMAYLGNPQDSYKSVHVAGTSGKTSTTYYIAAMLRAAGYKVGHTVSPHVDLISERAQINMQSLDEADYCASLNEFMEEIAPSGIELSYFELLVAFAYWLFAKREVEYAVVEVGLGGLLDGTNVITRSDKVCVITDIGLDHTNILGDTVAKIAVQKAGIIHHQNIVFMHGQAADIMQSVRHQCQAQEAELRLVTADVDGITHDLPLFQQRNWHLASAAANYVLGRDHSRELTQSELSATLTTYIPARMETIRLHDKLLILDGSHNEQKIGALVHSLREKYPTEPCRLLVSFGENKVDSVQASLGLLATISSSIVFTEFKLAQDHLRAPIPVERLAEYARSAGFTTVVTDTNPEAALHAVIAGPEKIVVITGSFYLFNHVRPVLQELLSQP